jgi:RNA polymerase sporulation-specific sigma factor
MSTGRVVMLRAQTNEQLALAAQAGDRAAEEALLALFGGYVRTLASPYFDATGDADDLLQEARLGALKAIRDWRADGGASFKTFLGLCVTRNIHTHVTWSNRQKHQMLTHSLREVTNEDGDTVDALEQMASAIRTLADLDQERAA